MTVTTPDLPLWMQNPPYSARADRQLIEAIWPNEGIVFGLEVTQRAAGANLSVDVARGRGAILGEDQANQGNYLAGLPAVANVPIDPPAPPTRIDVTSLAVRDPAAGGPAGNIGVVGKAKGNPSATNPMPSAIPPTAIELARVTVNPGVSTITNAVIDSGGRFYAGSPGTIARFPNRTIRAHHIPNPSLGQVTVLDNWPWGCLHVWDGAKWVTTLNGSVYATTNSDAVVYQYFNPAWADIPYS